MKTALAFCLTFNLLFVRAEAARLALPAVPHYEFPESSLPQPAAPPRYTEQDSGGQAAANQEHNKDGPPKSLWDRFTDDPVAFATLLLTGVTGILAVSTVGLWIVTGRAARRQSLDMRASIRIAERALVDVERALIVGIKVDTTGLVRNQRVIGQRFTILFVNTGRTPAKRMTSNANTAVFDGENSVPMDFRYPDRIPASENQGILGMGIPFPIPLDIAVQDLVDIQQKHKTGIVYGWIEYDDIFVDSCRRRTEFCARIEVVGDPYFISERVGGPRMFGFAVYGKYNGTDEDCFYKPGQVPVAGLGELPPVTQPAPPGTGSVI